MGKILKLSPLGQSIVELPPLYLYS